MTPCCLVGINVYKRLAAPLLKAEVLFSTMNTFSAIKTETGLFF